MVYVTVLKDNESYPIPVEGENNRARLWREGGCDQVCVRLAGDPGRDRQDDEGEQGCIQKSGCERERVKSNAPLTIVDVIRSWSGCSNIFYFSYNNTFYFYSTL